MAGRDNEQNPTGHFEHRLDSELDAALAKYSAVEPRAGLEERVLANLRAERARVPNHSWWRWSVAGALTAVVLAALVLGWKLGKSPVMVNHPSTSRPDASQLQTNVAANGGAKQLPPTGRVPKPAVRRPRPTVFAAVNPKLDQFPSPQPLTEQEKILASYVARFHAQAVLIARVANEEIQQDRAELIDKPQGPAGAAHEDQANTNR